MHCVSTKLRFYNSSNALLIRDFKRSIFSMPTERRITPGNGYFAPQTGSTGRRMVSTSPNVGIKGMVSSSVAINRLHLSLLLVSESLHGCYFIGRDAMHCVFTCIGFVFCWDTTRHDMSCPFGIVSLRYCIVETQDLASLH